MRILDENGNELINPDFAEGYYVEDTIIIAHHPAQRYIPEEYHYEIIAEYPNGGKDVAKIIDVPGQEAKEAWDDVETILRWHWYSNDDPRPPQNMIANTNIEKNQYFMVGSGLYYATSPIPQNSALVLNKNCVKVDLASALNTINSLEEVQ